MFMNLLNRDMAVLDAVCSNWDNPNKLLERVVEEVRSRRVKQRFAIQNAGANVASRNYIPLREVETGANYGKQVQRVHGCSCRL
jgi:hypothetical protein